jgi:hypothetical protein
LLQHVEQQQVQIAQQQNQIQLMNQYTVQPPPQQQQQQSNIGIQQVLHQPVSCLNQPASCLTQQGHGQQPGSTYYELEQPASWTTEVIFNELVDTVIYGRVHSLTAEAPTTANRGTSRTTYPESTVHSSSCFKPAP